MTTTKPVTIMKNIPLRTNILYKSHDTIPVDNIGHHIRVEFPIYALGKVQIESNKPLSSIRSYVENQKTIVQNVIKPKTQNQNENFKNMMYLSERDRLDSKVSNKLYNYSQIYANEKLDAKNKASYATRKEFNRQLNNDIKNADFVRQVNENVKFNQSKSKKEKNKEQKNYKETVLKTYDKLKGNISKWIGNDAAARSASVGGIHGTNDLNEGDCQEAKIDSIEGQMVRKASLSVLDIKTKHKKTIEKNISNLREFMGYRSDETQNKVIDEENQRKSRLDMMKAQKAKELEKIEKYMDMKELSKKWKIYDMNQLKAKMRNDLIKNVFKDEERNIYMHIAKKSPEKPKNSPGKTTKEANLPVSNTKNQQPESANPEIRPKTTESAKPRSKSPMKSRMNENDKALQEQAEITKKFLAMSGKKKRPMSAFERHKIYHE